MTVKLNALLFFRLASGMSQGELARLSGVSQPTISQIERGPKGDSNLGTLKKLAETLSRSGLGDEGQLLGHLTRGDIHLTPVTQ
jgi:transcriptional regulator with XRE-family HTH domain